MSGQGGPSLPLCPPVVCFLGFTSQPESLGHCPGAFLLTHPYLHTKTSRLTSYRQKQET